MEEVSVVGQDAARHCNVKKYRTRSSSSKIRRGRARGVRERKCFRHNWIFTKQRSRRQKCPNREKGWDK